MTRGDLIATIVALPFCLALIAWISISIVEHFTPEPPYVCTPHKYERGECLPEIKPGDTTRYCPKSLCGENRWYAND